MAREQSGTQTVLAGTVTATVTGSFIAPYEVGVLPGWATDTFVVPASKTATQFVVQFPIAPSADATFDWGVLDSA